MVFSGLTQPTAVAFSPDGRVFVAEKSGRIKVYSNLSDTTATTFADLRANTHNYYDRGLLGLALHPNFPSTPYVYVLYTHDAEIGGTAPRWGAAGATSDGCPTPPGGNGDGCVVSGRLSRLEAFGDVAGSELVLIEDWFQQYPSHSIGSLFFGPDGALYASGGDGASFIWVDYGQDGEPLNPGGDPPVPIGGIQTPPTAGGGALRSQDLRTAGDPVTLDGTVIRIDPMTGAGLPDNPLAGDPDPNARRIIAYGLRNPFRVTPRPGTSEIWVGDVGWNSWEEINRIRNAGDSTVENFGWPCYEGVGHMPSYDNTNLNICEGLYSQAGAVVSPYYAYNHSSKVVQGEPCSTGSSSITGLAFYAGASYPSIYQNALFFADYSRNCVWAMLPGGGGDPDPSNLETFISAAGSPVQLTIGPGGDLFYVDIAGGKIHRVRYFVPTAVISANPSSGNVPLTVLFDASGSTHPNPGEPLTFSWDLDGDGTYGDSTEAQPTWTYESPGTYTVRLQVTDSLGGADIEQVVINVDNTTPTPTIDAPPAGMTWKVGDVIAFSGSATDPQEGPLPATALSWTMVLHHCPSNCHTHTVQTFNDTGSGSFTAEDHEYPSHLEVKLTATDSGGLQTTASVLLFPQTTTLTLASSPAGLQLSLNGETASAPFTRSVITGSSNSLAAPSPQILEGRTYEFVSWSDAGARSHNVTAPPGPIVHTAIFAERPSLQAPWVSQDVGAVGQPGSATFSSGTFTLEGSGAYIGGTADQFQFVYQSLPGDGEIRARVTGIENTHLLARAGVMIRESLTSGSTFAAATLSANNRIGFQRRLTTGATASSGEWTETPPRWVRLVRSGNTFTAYRSSNGTSWTLSGTATIPMTASVYIGLVTTSANNTTLSTGTLDNVTVTGGN